MALPFSFAIPHEIHETFMEKAFPSTLIEEPSWFSFVPLSHGVYYFHVYKENSINRGPPYCSRWSCLVFTIGYPKQNFRRYIL